MNVPRTTPNEMDDDPTEQLEPDDLVDERRAAAADEQQDEERHEAGRDYG
jgi:hypothetical protein